MLDAAVLPPLLLTLKVSTLATALATIPAVALARLARVREFPGRDLADAILTLPMVLPPTVLGYYIIVLLGRRGVFGSYLWDTFGISIMFTWEGAVIAAAVVAFPLVYRSARAAFEGVDENLENAARTLGASETVIFFRVSMPLAMRGLLAGIMLALARAMGEFGATLMVAGNLPGKTQTLSLAVYSATQAGNDTLANELVLLISVVCVVLLVIVAKVIKPKA
ncbi:MULTISPECIES: molybdate ABC transporter permease subunit [Solidesulfovibrio]|jgi:molybdate transport system permease protein|uniref:molybdate ABC transporter permease subunit n=1 Tax=Solidesulfovibrio TaxID=2910984 RepID=UPI000495EA1C|nr:MULTISPECIES: molybdate ABC transporter permease subunit [Solidesulfovibrio]MEA5090159.1 molybdate ABC transporter permease subunit [Solidesulfovibrio sp.]HCR13595.1 molybdate ABC transporter permease subunit [Desulfovibrio sp.]HML59973.1 molybdate ABC transporter permease subunit [Solidesulfovibrio sp.]